MKRQLHGKLHGDPHMVPLPRQAVQLLRELHPLTGPDGYVFRGERDHERAMSENTVNAALRRMGSNTNIDLRRLAVMGQGYGGYATLMASTQSHPFKAAIALSAFGDLSSDYARLSPATRLSQPQDALPFVHRQSHYYEKGPIGMGQPPWQDPQLWVRNSPYYQAGRVQLPVLLITGSQDGHLPQAEQFFTALYRQGKPARLVRYQDEAQLVGRADHVVDEWRQIHMWLQRYLGEEATGVKPESGT